MNTHPLHDQRIIAALGIEAAERCLQEELLKPFWPDYRRRRADYRALLALVDAQLHPPAYNGWYAAIGRHL